MPWTIMDTNGSMPYVGWQVRGLISLFFSSPLLILLHLFLLISIDTMIEGGGGGLAPCIP